MSSLTEENISWSVSWKESWQTWRGSNPHPPDHKTDWHSHPTKTSRSDKRVGFDFITMSFWGSIKLNEGKSYLIHIFPVYNFIHFMHRILKHNSFSSDQLHSNVDHTYFNKHSCLVIINLAVSADNFFFLFVPENRICHFMQIVSNLHEMRNPVLWGKYEKTISKCLLLKFLSRLLS